MKLASTLLASLGLFATGVVSHGAPAAPAAPASFEAKLKPFLDKHCIDCHDSENHKGGLRLDNLPADFRSIKTSKTWSHVFDKVVSGEMPPKKKARPAQQELYGAMQFLYTNLRGYSLDQQQKKGRVVVRRMNGLEYENTLRDLTGTRVAIKDMLPEDNTTAGFDNVSSGLDLSATHFLLYQEAAAKAVAAAIPVSPNIPFSDMRTGKEMSEKGPNFKQTLTRSCMLKGDALVIYSTLPRYGLCTTAPVQVGGRYKVTMSACAVGAEGKPIPVGFMTVESSGRESPVLKEVREIPHGKPATIEFEFDLARRQQFVVNVLTTWDIRRFKKPIEEYDGPGLMVEWLKVEGPLDAFPPPSYNHLFAGVPLKARSVVKAEETGGRAQNVENRRADQWYADPLVPASTNPKQDAERLIRSFLPRAFRRPVSEDVQRRYIQKVNAKLDDKYSFADAMTYGYKLILSSPDFLFLSDTSGADPTPQGDLVSPKLDDFSLAERLSYFLWSTMPDEELLAVAKKGELSKPPVLSAQVERMLNSPKARKFTENFAGQWLDLRKIDFTIPDPVLYNDFDQLLLWAMPRETQLFFEEVLSKNLSLFNFIDSDWTMLNERLAELYGIPGVKGNELRKVSLPPGSHRGGVMTHASVLKVTADGTRTSPVLRGKWVLERILGQHPSPPPPDTPAIEPDIRGATTIREQLDKHRNTPACATCHIHIDPPGFAMENYDPIGNWREFYRVTERTKAGIVDLPRNGGRVPWRGPDVEQGGQTPDGKPFKNMDDYKKLLLQNKDQLARNVIQQVMVYSTGAEIQFADREVVEQILANLKTKNYGFRTLIHEVVQSRVFLNK